MSELQVKLKLLIDGDKVVVQGIDGVEKKINSTTKQANALTTAFKGLLPAITAAAVSKFFIDSIKLAEHENEVLRKLKGTIESYGQSWTDAEKAIKQTAMTVKAKTRFDEEEVYTTIDKLTVQLGNYKQAIILTNTAMDVAALRGMELSDVMGIFNAALASPQRGVRTLRIAFGDLVGDATNVHEAFNNIGIKAQGAKEKEDSLTKSTKQLQNNFEDLRKELGNNLNPAVKILYDLMNKTFERQNQIDYDARTQEIVKYRAELNQLTKGTKEYEAMERLLNGVIKRRGEINDERNKKKPKPGDDKITETPAEKAAREAEEKKKVDEKIKKDEEENYKKRLELGQMFSDAQSQLVTDLAAGNVDAWKNYYKMIIDIAFKSTEDLIKLQLANAFALAWVDPTKWGSVAALTGQLLGLEGLKAGLKVPAMAEGGIVKATPGGTLVRVGEAGRDEKITPLGKDNSDKRIIINVNGFADKNTINYLIRELKKAENNGGGL